MKVILLFFSLAPAAFGADLSELARSEGWQKLLFYKSHWFTGRVSAVDGPGFFLSPHGKSDPEKELIATLAAMRRGGGSFGKHQQPVSCAFPARKIFLERALAEKFPEEPCPDLDEFLQRLDPGGVSLAFATSYPGNPASMFGHSFLKVTSRAGGSELLHWSINYAAMVPQDENPFAFAFFGLAGGYAGQFALVPYYAKIEEYGYLEGRDIWEFELNLSPGEIDFLLKAIWEIETNSFSNYFFSDENCSLQYLTLLEAVRPELDLSRYFVHMIPGESIKRVTAVPGLVKQARMRPSLERRLNVVAASLDKNEWGAFNKAKNQQEIKGLGPRPLQAYLLYLQAEKKRKQEKWTKGEEAHFRQALVLRASQPQEAGEIKEFGGESSRPDLGHGPYRIGIGAVAGRLRGWKYGAELSIRFAYHDLLDADPGYMSHSEVHFPNFRFRFYEGGKFSLEEAELLSIVSLTPWNLVRKPWAWRAKASYGRISGECVSCRGVLGEAGFGSAWSLRPEKFTLWAMMGGEGVWSARVAPDFRAAPWLEAGSLFTLPAEGKILFHARVAPGFGRNFRGYGRVNLGANHPFSQNWAVRFEGQLQKKLGNGEVSSETTISALRYF